MVENWFSFEIICSTPLVPSLCNYLKISNKRFIVGCSEDLRRFELKGFGGTCSLYPAIVDRRGRFGGGSWTCGQMDIRTYGISAVCGGWWDWFCVGCKVFIVKCEILKWLILWWQLSLWLVETFRAAEEIPKNIFFLPEEEVSLKICVRNASLGNLVFF